MKRVLTALLLIPITLAVVIWAPLWLFAVLVLALALMALREFYDLAQAQGAAPYRWLGLSAAALLVLVLEVPLDLPLDPSSVVIGVVVGCLLAVLLGALAHPQRLPFAIGDAGSTLLGVLYLGGGFGLTGAVRMWGAGWLVFLLAVVWLGDTAAYYVGRAVGRHAMAPHVSPHKTWEGAAASMLVAILVGAGFGHWSLGAPLTFAALAAFLNVAAQLGDLAESVVKRAAHVKDSGSLLPGHGGILDRLDAMLFAAPALWYYLVYFRR